MKLNTVFLFSCLIISITSEIDWNSYSIEPFKEYLKNEGLLEIIESILMTYSQDVAILCCEELVGNRKGNCKRLVIEYINPSYNSTEDITRGLQNITCIQKLYYSMITNKDIQDSLVIKNELRKKFTDSLSNLIFKKIVKRIKDLGPCEE